jgi:secondary thiamine-phosphate synthase enzyme
VHEIRLRTARRSHVVDITADVREAIGDERGAAVLVYVPHTTAGVTINEHADPAVARDFEAALERIVEDGWPWQHLEPGEENAPTHVRASLMGPSVVVPLRDDGSLALGTWQGIFFCEFDGPRDRVVQVSVLG